MSSEDSAGGQEAAGLARLRRELARGTGELAVLAVVDSGRRYGFELLKLLQAADVLDIREGTLYPLLHRLEDAGHISSTWQAAGRSTPRKYYSITPAGRSHLAALRAEWLRLAGAMARLLAAGEQPTAEVPT